MLCFLATDETMSKLVGLLEALPAADMVDPTFLRAFLKTAPATVGVKPRDVLSPLRFLLTGTTAGSPLEDIIPVLGSLFHFVSTVWSTPRASRVTFLSVSVNIMDTGRDNTLRRVRNGIANMKALVPTSTQPIL
jgi:hypothetical protein